MFSITSWEVRGLVTLGDERETMLVCAKVGRHPRKGWSMNILETPWVLLDSQEMGILQCSPKKSVEHLPLKHLGIALIDWIIHAWSCTTSIYNLQPAFDKVATVGWIFCNRQFWIKIQLQNRMTSHSV